MESLREGLTKVVARIRRAPVIDEKTLKEVIREIQRALLRADVSVDIIMELSRRIEERVKKAQLPPGFSKRELLLKIVYEELVRMLGGERCQGFNADRIRKSGKKPYVVMLVGIQGSGKTTTAAKLANFYKKHGFKVGLLCADTYRPGALQQLKQLATLVGCEFYGEENGNPVGIVKRGLEHFKAKKCDVVIVDTAGRHKEEQGLIREMIEISKQINPDEVILVLDGTIGRQAAAQAEAFHRATPIGSIIVTKLDGTAKGGGALAAAAKTGATISFIGTGEKIDDFEPFDAASFVSRLLGLGDLRALLERFKAWERARRLKEIKAPGKFTLLDMKEQLEQLRSMGPLRKILELLPGTPSLPASLEQEGEENIKKWLAIMNSMTIEELLNPEIIDRSRMVRIARGSGTTPRDVKSLLVAYNRTKKLLKRMLKQRRSKDLYQALGGWGF